MDRPRHDLKKTPVERRREAFPVGGAGAGRMHVVRIDAGPHDGFKLRKSVSSFSPAGFVRSQVARNNVWKHSRRPRNQNEVPTAAQVRVRINFRRLLVKVRVSAHGKFGGRARGVAAIAVTHSVDNIAAQSYQAPVFPDKIKRDRRDFKSSMNSCLISLVIVVMVAAPYWMGLCQTCGVGGLYLVPDRSQGIRRY